MAEENRSVILHGIWASPYVKRVELALRIKGIPFDFVEEDLVNKSAFLLKCNPVYKRVPVLLHNGKPIVESLIVLQYIEETWKDEPRLLPEDPYQRARVRFWAGYIDQLLEVFGKLFKLEGKEALDEACKETFEKLGVLEEGIKNLFSENGRLTDHHHQQNMGLLDIMIISTFGAFRAHEEVLGFKVLNPEKYPIIFQWVTTLIELPVVKVIIPPHQELVSLLKQFRGMDNKFPSN